MRRHAARGVVTAAVLAAALAAAGCDDNAHRDIGDEINILTRRNDALVPPAMRRLARYGRAALSQIETAIHTAAPFGRLNLIGTLDLIGDADAVAILRHVAVYDVKPEVRAACDDILRRWAAAGGARGDRARGGMAFVAERRAKGEGPVLFGENGTPGAPSTVGAPEAVGAKLERTKPEASH